MTRSFPVDVLWCANSGKGRSNRWSFPPNVERLLRHEFKGKRVLHPFGGKSRFGVRMDIDSIVRPDVIADAWMPPFGRDSFDVVILDPPYVHINANVKVALFRQYMWIARERIVWFHTQWASTYSGVRIERAWLVRVGDACHVRCLQIFEPREPKRPPLTHFRRGPGMKYNRWLSGELPLPFGEASPAASRLQASTAEAS